MRAALSPSQEVELLARADAGEALTAIAASLGLDERRVRSIVREAAPPPDPDGAPPLPPKPKPPRKGGPRGGPLPRKTEAVRAWMLAHPTKRAVIAARETGVSVAVAWRVRHELVDAGFLPAPRGLPRAPAPPRPRRVPEPIGFWLDADVITEMRAEARRHGLTLSEIAQVAWRRAREALRQRRAP